MYKFPWEESQEAKDWLASARIEDMRECALDLIFLELNAHTRELKILWERGWEGTGRRFREVVWLDSLWSTIWEFWGRDTNRLSWRRGRCALCRNCRGGWARLGKLDETRNGFAAIRNHDY